MLNGLAGFLKYFGNNDYKDVIKDYKANNKIKPSNTEHILCIGGETKTGFRMAFPISPEGHDWMKEFNLLQPLNLPDISNPLRRIGSIKGTHACTNKTGIWFRKKGYGFTAHDLRHAYNHRGHLLNYNPKSLADSLGHSLQMNGNNYIRHMSEKVKYQNIKKTIHKDKEHRIENETLQQESLRLNEEVERLKQENEFLKAKLKMYEAIQAKE